MNDGFKTFLVRCHLHTSFTVIIFYTYIVRESLKAIALLCSAWIRIFLIKILAILYSNLIASVSLLNILSLTKTCHSTVSDYKSNTYSHVPKLHRTNNRNVFSILISHFAIRNRHKILYGFRHPWWARTDSLNYWHIHFSRRTIYALSYCLYETNVYIHT